MNQKNFTIIDCTIRDGGHLNNWEYAPEVVIASYFAALKSGVDFFEIGYRFPYSKSGMGDFAYCKDDFLFSLFEANPKCKLLLMINANNAEDIEVVECDAKLTPISGIRVAAYPYEYDKAFKLLESLHQKGYLVYLNLMASSEINEEQYLQLQNWNNKSILGSIYFADSFGSFTPENIPYFIEKLQEIGYKNIGFHSHNNLQMAFANSLKALEHGCNFIDASIYGMGRGAGNLPIEILLGYLEKTGISFYNTLPYLDVIDRYYYKLHREIEWGYNLQTLMGGLANIHPYYVEEIFNRNSYTVEEIWNSTTIIKEKCPTSFSLKEFNKTMEERFYTPLSESNTRAIFNQISEEFKIIPSSDAIKSDTFEFSNTHSGKKILIIANGPSLKTYSNQIKELIKKEQMITIGINFIDNIIPVDYHLFINRKRFQKYIHTIDPNSKLMLPSFFGKNYIQENYKGAYTFFNLDIVDSNSDQLYENNTISSVYPNVSITAIMIAKIMGASEILAVGIDGYQDELDKKIAFFYNENDTPDDKEIASLRYEMFSKELDRTNNYLQKNSVPFFIITPTSHKKYYKKTL